MDIQEAINMAPEWATHISVGRGSNNAEFFNSVDWSQNILQGRRADFGEQLFNNILLGTNNNWYFVEIPKNLENE